MVIKINHYHGIEKQNIARAKTYLLTIQLTDPPWQYRDRGKPEVE